MHLELEEENATARRTLMKIVDPYKKNCAFYKKRCIPLLRQTRIISNVFKRYMNVQILILNYISRMQRGRESERKRKKKRENKKYLQINIARFLQY